MKKTRLCDSLRPSRLTAGWGSLRPKVSIREKHKTRRQPANPRNTKWPEPETLSACDTPAHTAVLDPQPPGNTNVPVSNPPLRIVPIRRWAIDPSERDKTMSTSAVSSICNIERRTWLSGRGLAAMAAGFVGTWWFLFCAHKVNAIFLVGGNAPRDCSRGLQRTTYILVCTRVAVRAPTCCAAVSPRD